MKRISYSSLNHMVWCLTCIICRWTSPESGETKEDMVFCTDILDALTQDFFARKGNPIEEPTHVEEVKVGLNQDICSLRVDWLKQTSAI